MFENFKNLGGKIKDKLESAKYMALVTLLTVISSISSVEAQNNNQEKNELIKEQLAKIEASMIEQNKILNFTTGSKLSVYHANFNGYETVLSTSKDWFLVISPDGKKAYFDENNDGTTDRFINVEGEATDAIEKELKEKTEREDNNKKVVRNNLEKDSEPLEKILDYSTYALMTEKELSELAKKMGAFGMIKVKVIDFNGNSKEIVHYIDIGSGADQKLNEEDSKGLIMKAQGQYKEIIGTISGKK